MLLRFVPSRIRQSFEPILSRILSGLTFWILSTVATLSSCDGGSLLARDDPFF